MILKTKCPRTAIMTSYKRPVLYQKHILLRMVQLLSNLFKFADSFRGRNTN